MNLFNTDYFRKNSNPNSKTSLEKLRTSFIKYLTEVRDNWDGENTFALYKSILSDGFSEIGLLKTHKTKVPGFNINTFVLFDYIYKSPMSGLGVHFPLDLIHNHFKVYKLNGIVVNKTKFDPKFNPYVVETLSDNAIEHLIQEFYTTELTDLFKEVKKICSRFKLS